MFQVFRNRFEMDYPFFFYQSSSRVSLFKLFYTVKKVVTDVVKKDWSSLSTAEIDSLSKRVGKAMKEIFTNPAVHKTRKLGPRNLQKKYYVGVMLI